MMTLCARGEKIKDADLGLEPEHGRVGMILCALVALVLVALVAQTAIDHGGRKIIISNQGDMAQGPAVPLGVPAPDFALPATDGTYYTLSEQLGQPVLLVYFATW